MQDLCLPTKPAALTDRALFLRDDPFAPPAGTRLIPGSPIARMRDAAMRGDLEALRFQTVAMRGAMTDLRAAAEETAVERIIGALEKLGVDAGRVASDITAYIALARAAITLINSLIGFSNAFTNTDTETTVFAFPVEAGAVQVVQLNLKGTVKKENKGFVIGDNAEAINSAQVEFEVLQGPPVGTLVLFVTLRAFGVGQDAMTAPLQVTAGDGTGNPRPDPFTSEVDGPGVEIAQRSIFARAGTTTLTIDLNPSPGEIDYGINGANVALVLEVSGLAQYPFGTVGLNPVRALDIGLSI